jgi:hypothetical protein
MKSLKLFKFFTPFLLNKLLTEIGCRNLCDSNRRNMLEVSKDLFLLIFECPRISVGVKFPKNIIFDGYLMENALNEK